MKNLYLFLVCFYAVNIQAIDIHVNNSGQANSYSSVSAALSASNNGDRIFISPYQIYIEDLIIDKSLTISSAVIGNDFEIEGKVTVNAFPNMDLRIVGGDFSDSLVANTGTATLNNMADIYVIESNFENDMIFGDYIKTHLLFLNSSSPIFGRKIYLRHGEIVGCSIPNHEIIIEDGPNLNIGDTIKIIGNFFEEIQYNNDDNFFLISNNDVNNTPSYCNSCLSAIRIDKINYSSSINNLIINNHLNACNNTTSGGYNYCAGVINLSPYQGNSGNIFIRNNIIISVGVSNYRYGKAISFDNNGNTYSNPKFYFNSYNGGASDCDLIVGNITNISSGVNLGDPSIQYYDLDLTRNDIGPYGGPYSLENFFPTDSANGRARIYDLNIPSEIWSGNISVQSKGVHTK